MRVFFALMPAASYRILRQKIKSMAGFEQGLAEFAGKKIRNDWGFHCVEQRICFRSFGKGEMYDFRFPSKHRVILG